MGTDWKRELWARRHNSSKPWELIDTVSADADKAYVEREYRLAYGSGWAWEWRMSAEHRAVEAAGDILAEIMGGKNA